MPRGWKEVGGIEGRGVRDTKTQEELSILSTYLYVSDRLGRANSDVVSARTSTTASGTTMVVW